DRLQDALSELFTWSDTKTNDDEIISEKLLKQLQSEIRTANNKDYLQNCINEDLVRVLNILEKEIRRAVEMFNTQEDVISVIDQNKHILDIALDSSHIALSIMTGKNISKQVLVEEVKFYKSLISR